jgi:hypothetical protein
MGLKEARAHAQGGVICELSGLEGVPTAQLSEAIAAVRPFSLLVIGHVGELSIATARPLRGLTFNGISTRAPANLSGAALIGWATAAIRGARHITKSILLYGLVSEHAVRTVESLGATHVSVDA